MNPSKLSFTIDNVPIKFDMFCSIMKARYDTTAEMYREETAIFELKSIEGTNLNAEHINAYNKALEELKSFLDDIWASVEAIDFKAASHIENIDLRRIAFFYIGPAQMFNNIDNKKKVDSFTFKPDNRESNIGDTYHLWSISPKELGFEDRRRDVFAIQFWCPSTHREYWATVDDRENFCQFGGYSVKDAVAWLCEITHDKKQIKEINRQGEVYTVTYDVKDSSELKPVTPYYLSGDEFFKLINQQT